MSQIAKKHGFEKIDGEFQRRVNDVAQLFDQVRFWRQPQGSYDFDVQLKVFSPGFHKRVHGESVNPTYYFQIERSLCQLVGRRSVKVWSAENAQELSTGLDDLTQRFEELALPFFGNYDSEAKVVEAYREHSLSIRKTSVFAEWELAVYEGRATHAERPAPASPILSAQELYKNHFSPLFPDF